jgi:hypothetical protein
MPAGRSAASPARGGERPPHLVGGAVGVGGLDLQREPVERVATPAGVGSARTPRLHLARRLGTSPLAYRRRFSRNGFAQDARALTG